MTPLIWSFFPGMQTKPVSAESRVGCWGYLALGDSHTLDYTQSGPHISPEPSLEPQCPGLSGPLTTRDLLKLQFRDVSKGVSKGSEHPTISGL